ncbi:HTH-type transcriptional repressor nemR [Sphingobacterium spiritivorum]|uniref:HTH-type transcriptional repressor nemR n=1 Tax=Sphingobacterium spiritivorum TaxID=258 RepID=A0A380CWF4_SPHSI|nr:TetR/AcrR family transcriptional regulator [Sphingobacterium spiritivorum]SUJ29191.1 HTH-type transcriptional repressor nemR [Sphingobacterium spiritivorum]
MKIKEQILTVGEELLIEKGYNAFSYADIAKTVQIKTSSIHYYYPTKTDLGIAIVEKYIRNFNDIHLRQQGLDAGKRLRTLFDYYLTLISNNKICLIGTLASDSNSLEGALKEKAKEFCDLILMHTMETLKLGVENKEFKNIADIENKAIALLSSLMGLAQIGRLYSRKRIEVVMLQIIDHLKY